MALVRS